MKLKSDGHNTILLQAWTEGPAGRGAVCCLLDVGCHNNFIHESIVMALKLPVVMQETLRLHTFGSAARSDTKHNAGKGVLAR